MIFDISNTLIPFVYEFEIIKAPFLGKPQINELIYMHECGMNIEALKGVISAGYREIEKIQLNGVVAEKCHVFENLDYGKFIID